MTTDKPKACPVCGNAIYDKHCASPTCPWMSCRRASCEAIIDHGKGIGYRKGGTMGWLPITLGPDGKAVA